MADTPFDIKLWARDTAERSLTTFVQVIIVFLPALLAGNYDTNLGKTILVALLPALGSVILNAATAFLPAVKSFVADLVVRAARTFIVTVTGAMAATQFDLLSTAAWKAVILSAAVAVLAVVKGILAKHFVSNTITPASLAKAA